MVFKITKRAQSIFRETIMGSAAQHGKDRWGGHWQKEEGRHCVDLFVVPAVDGCECSGADWRLDM